MYRYDLPGRLTDVSLDGVAVSHYAYDADDNRASVTIGGVTTQPLYDAQDRLTNYGATAYDYGPNGELAHRFTSAQTMSTTYDDLGNLGVAPSGVAR